MYLDQIIELIQNSDSHYQQKNVYLGVIERLKEDISKKREDRQLIEQVANLKNLSEVILSTDDVKIYTVYGKDEWDIKYPFRSIYIGKKGTWERSNTVSANLDQAFLVYLQYKYLGANSQFVDFAFKMLELPNEEHNH